MVLLKATLFLKFQRENPPIVTESQTDVKYYCSTEVQTSILPRDVI